MDNGPKFPHLWLALKRLFLAPGYAYAAIWFIPVLIGPVIGKVIYEMTAVFYATSRDFALQGQGR